MKLNLGNYLLVHFKEESNLEKIFYFNWSYINAVLLASCGSKSVIQETTDATEEQSKVIEDMLAEENVSYDKISVSNSPIIDELGEDYKAYDLTAEDDSVNILILRKSDNDFVAALDDEGNIIIGIIDNTVLPDFFKQ